MVGTCQDFRGTIGVPYLAVLRETSNKSIDEFVGKSFAYKESKDNLHHHGHADVRRRLTGCTHNSKRFNGRKTAVFLEKLEETAEHGGYTKHVGDLFLFE